VQGYVITNDAPINFPIGTTTVNWTVTDIGGNTATCTQTVTVTDAENPVINCPANITQNTDAGDCGAVVTFAVTSSDNCPGESINQTAGLSKWFNLSIRNNYQYFCGNRCSRKYFYL
jgi:hypothetical protein